MRAPARPNDEAAQVSEPDRWHLRRRARSRTLAACSGGFGAFRRRYCVCAFLERYRPQIPQHRYITWGYDPEFIRNYIEKFGQFDPFAIAQFFFEIEQPISIADIMPHSEFRKSRFYEEWVRPQHWIDAIAATLEKSATTYAAFSVIRHEKDEIVNDETRRRMKLIVPHMRRAVAIGKVIDLHRVEAAALADALDGLAAAMFLVDPVGRIVHANAAAHAMLDIGSVIRGSGGKLAAADPQADRTLHDIFHERGKWRCSRRREGYRHAALCSRDGERYVAHVLPLTAGARRKAGVAYSAVAAVFVRKAALELPHPLEAIASTFKLTPAEMRVLMMIVQFGSLQEVAPRARRFRGDGEDTFAANFRQNRHEPPSRPGQAGRRLYEPARLIATTAARRIRKIYIASSVRMTLCAPL